MFVLVRKSGVMWGNIGKYITMLYKIMLRIFLLDRIIFYYRQFYINKIRWYEW